MTLYPVRVLVAVRTRMVGDGLVSHLRGEKIDVIATATDGRDALNLALLSEPDVAVLDAALSPISAVDITRELTVHTSVRVVMLSSGSGARRELEAARPMVRGFVPLTEPISRLVDTIRDVAEGALCVPNGRPTSVEVLSTTGELVTLGGHQLSVLELLVHGLTSAEIGDQLGIVERTVGNHRAAVMKKLGVRNVAQLVRLAIRQGLANP